MIARPFDRVKRFLGVCRFPDGGAAEYNRCAYDLSLRAESGLLFAGRSEAISFTQAGDCFGPKDGPRNDYYRPGVSSR